MYSSSQVVLGLAEIQLCHLMIDSFGVKKSTEI